MKRIPASLLLLLSMGLGLAQGQIRLPAWDARIAPEVLDCWTGHEGYNNGRWSASWITSPDADADFGVYFFRKSLTLTEVPAEFIIHVSADNRYKLYVNGVQVFHGPSKGDPRNWAFDTVDIAPYALFWLNSCHDWWMYRGDEAYLRTLLPAMRSTLAWFEEYLGPDGLLHRIPSWNFADWAGLDNGTFPVDAEGRSAYLDLIHILALRDAAEMEDAFGDPRCAAIYRQTADTEAEAAKATYWSEERELFADDGARKNFSQHINALAILADLVGGEEASALMTRTLEDKDLRECTIYFRYYLQRAMVRSGHGDELIPGFGVLRDQMALGLTTWAEMPEPSRSDCHAWGSTPNIEFFRTVLGIDSAAPGFRRVRVAPSLGPLREVSGFIPHPQGSVSVSCRLAESGALEATVTLPQGVEGSFEWKGRSIALRPGVNDISL